MKKYFKNFFTENYKSTSLCFFFALIALIVLMLVDLFTEEGYLNPSTIKFSVLFINFVLVSISCLSCLIAIINITINKNYLEYFFNDKKLVLEGLKNNGIIKRTINYNIILLVLCIISIIFAFIGGIVCFSGISDISVSEIYFVQISLITFIILHLVGILQIQFTILFYSSKKLSQKFAKSSV